MHPGYMLQSSWAFWLLHFYHMLWNLLKTPQYFRCLNLFSCHKKKRLYCKEGIFYLSQFLWILFLLLGAAANNIMKILCSLLKWIKKVGFIFCFHTLGMTVCSGEKDTTFQVWWHLGTGLNGHSETEVVTGTLHLQYEVFLLVLTMVSLLFLVS